MRRRSTRKANQTGCTLTSTDAQTTGGDLGCAAIAVPMVAALRTFASSIRRCFQTTLKRRQPNPRLKTMKAKPTETRAGVALPQLVSRLWRNWPVHNLIAHPLSEIVHWITAPFFGSKISGWVHDATIPRHKPGQGRG